MPVTLLVEVKQHLGALVPGWVTVVHTVITYELMFDVDKMSTFFYCLWFTANEKEAKS